MPRPLYEIDDKAFPHDAYRVKRQGSIAWLVYGWELEQVLEDDFYDEDTDELYVGTEFVEQRSGRVVCKMVGDDRFFTFDPDDLVPLNDLDYCAECGQIGCTHDGRDRSDDNA